MIKLMKYEIRKQLFSKFALLGILGLLEIWFFYGLLADKEMTATKATVFLVMLAFVGILYVSFECIVTFSNDLKTKQSYMLFMVPQSIYSIMGAKVISAMLQIILTALVFGIVAFMDIAAVYSKYGELEELVRALRQVLTALFELEIDVGKIVIAVVNAVVSWCSVIVIGMFSITLSATFMANTRLKGIVSFVIFIAISVVISKIDSQITNGLYSSYAEYIGSIAFDLAVTVAMYFGTAWMLEKKVSV